MRCAQAQELSSDYLDGELSPDASAAVRGHLRTCAACEQSFEEEAVLVEAVAGLRHLDPPDSVWEGIAARIASEEVRDSERGVLYRWLRRRFQPVTFAGLGLLTAAALLVFLVARDDAKRSRESTAAGQNDLIATAMPSPAAPTQTFAAEREAELVKADRHYLESIAELRELVEEDREGWSAAEAGLVDATLASFRRDAIGKRLAVTGGESGVDIDRQGRSALYAGYRTEISFLQATLAGDLPGGS